MPLIGLPTGRHSPRSSDSVARFARISSRTLCFFFVVALRAATVTVVLILIACTSTSAGVSCDHKRIHTSSTYAQQVVRTWYVLSKYCVMNPSAFPQLSNPSRSGSGARRRPREVSFASSSLDRSLSSERVIVVIVASSRAGSTAELKSSTVTDTAPTACSITEPLVLALRAAVVGFGTSCAASAASPTANVVVVHLPVHLLVFRPVCQHRKHID